MLLRKIVPKVGFMASLQYEVDFYAENIEIVVNLKYRGYEERG